MPETETTAPPPIAPAPNVVIQPPPVVAKGFDDPMFESTMHDAFKRRADNEKTKTAPAEVPSAPTQSAPTQQAEPEPKLDRPPVPRKAAEWEAFHQEKKRIEKERDEFKVKLDQFNGFDPKQYEETKTANQKLIERLEAVALERSDKFQAAYNGEKENIMALIKTVVDDKAPQVATLLELPHSKWRTEQLAAISEGLDGFSIARLERACADMDKLNLNRARTLEKSNENWKALQEVEKIERAREAKQLDDVFEEQIKAMSNPKDGIAPYQIQEGNQEWNNEIKTSTDLARKIFKGELPPNERARHAAIAAIAPRVIKAVMATMEENQKLNAELIKLRGSEPGLADAGKTPTPSGKEYEGMNYGESIAAMVEKAGGFGR